MGSGATKAAPEAETMDGIENANETEAAAEEVTGLSPEEIQQKISAKDEAYEKTLDTQHGYYNAPHVKPLAETTPKKIRDDKWTVGDPLHIFCGTWNMEGCSAPKDLHEFITPSAYHIYAIGSQECLRSIQRSFLVSDKQDWEDSIQETLGKRYVKIGFETLVAIHVAVFVRADVACHINEKTVETASVTTGAFGGSLGNKGGVGVGFILGPPASSHSTTFLFLSGHFEAHQHAVSERNHDYKTITEDIKLGTKGKAVYKILSPDEKPIRDVTDEYDCVFFMGDFNYRVNGTRTAVEGLLDSTDPEIRNMLLANDQLLLEMRREKVFKGFNEPQVKFLPTYKFAPQSDTYETAKMRIPSWTDRVLYRQHPGMMEKRCAPAETLVISPFEYTSIQTMRHSDHRPVRASFVVGTPLPEISPSRVVVKNTDQSSACVVM